MKNTKPFVWINRKKNALRAFFNFYVPARDGRKRDPVAGLS